MSKLEDKVNILMRVDDALAMASRSIQGELEIQYRRDEGWYAMDYREFDGGVFLINSYFDSVPLLTEKEADKYNIDIDDLFYGAYRSER